MSRYRIPRQRVRVETGVWNSRFIATIAPVATVKAAQAFVREMRAEMPDATHHVYAFRIGYGASVSEGMSDDGEPSGTSGPPTLAVVRGSDVGDVVLVTARYFGGTKLGTGGLVSAYTAAAQAAFAALETEERVIRVRMECTIPYRILRRVRQMLERWECVQVEEQFGAEVGLRFLVPEESVDTLVSGMNDLSNGSVTPRAVGRLKAED